MKVLNMNTGEVFLKENGKHNYFYIIGRSKMNKDKKRIANLMAAMKLTKDKEMKDIWSKKLEDLIKLQKRRMNERFQPKSKLVH